MNLDLRLSTALHVLLHLPADGAPITSEALARCTRANPVVVRRTMAGLREARIVRAEKGRGGGWSLRQDPSTVTLLDVHVALGGPGVFAMGARRGAPGCLVERAVEDVLGDALREAEALLTRRLDAVTLHDLSVDLRRRAAAREPSVHDRHVQEP
ncbi:Rrf2 family transcriptional regulator [Myxococcota bacterium]|nr:Rrf2 family transcriptional regulator [Myxococcota bacterium]